MARHQRDLKLPANAQPLSSRASFTPMPNALQTLSGLETRELAFIGKLPTVLIFWHYHVLSWVDAVQFRTWSPTFRRNLLPPYSTLKTEAAGSHRNVDNRLQYHNSEQHILSLHHRCCYYYSTQKKSSQIYVIINLFSPVPFVIMNQF
jgi:hypothetical protein